MNGTPMNGRDLIMYILSNHLEDEPVFKDGKFIGFVTAGEAAAKMDVGTATIYTWMHQGRLHGVIVGDTVYIPANFHLMNEGSQNNG